jgi:hypothetical protein
MGICGRPTTPPVILVQPLISSIRRKCPIILNASLGLEKGANFHRWAGRQDHLKARARIAPDAAADDVYERDSNSTVTRNSKRH